MTAILRGHDIRDYSDANGNSIVGAPACSPGASIEFKGANCRVVFGTGSKFGGAIVFHRNNSSVSMGKWAWYRGRITLGLECAVSMGEKFYSGFDLQISTAEGAGVTFGDDVLIANQCRIRADDSHPIYDGVSGERINPSRSIAVGDHVWIGQEVFVMPGSTIGSGCVIGARSVVTRSRPVPPHTLALGSPATVHREKINWVRTHLQMNEIPDSVPSIFSADELVGN
ncbi:acetyltransferase-like isoleucine patch superfamily enzyme [Pseudarthrobacter oxydans]|uniref:acyltransferase n=1 Tax=Pseudarthrobacter oxydans TaxID=1671 RepID=UPI002785FA32|nr:acyltransferase [Pseudarthrobacter oxydans]MDP9982881.1 acetyltransferase-like isoleucine patch superfamily enzyme [Pseudarthrobacter oxydans]